MSFIVSPFVEGTVVRVSQLAAGYIYALVCLATALVLLKCSAIFSLPAIVPDHGRL